MIWQKDTPVILYGAAHAGTLIYSYLKEFCNIAAFIDKRAEELQTHMGLPVLRIDSDFMPERRHKAETIVVVCVQNIFDHEKIAHDLLKHAYENIIFCPVDGSSVSYRNDDERALLAKIYNCVVDCSLELPVNIPPTRGLFSLIFTDSAIICKEENSIIAKVPSFFTSTRIVGNGIWQDSPILTLFPHLEVFDWFSGEIGVSPDYYIDLYCKGSADGTEVKQTGKWEKNILDSRKTIYERMRSAEEYYPEFFEEHSVKASLNLKGYFNMESGKHRAVYSIHRRRVLVPLKLLPKDYATYLNMSAADELICFIEKENILELPYPVYHPYFLKMPFDARNSYYELLLKFSRWLSIRVYEDKGKVGLNDISLLDTTDGMLFAMLQCMSKLGCKVEHIYPAGEFGEILNRLYSIARPPVHNKNPKGGYDVVVFDYRGEAPPCIADYYAVLFNSLDELEEAKIKLALDIQQIHLFNGRIFAVARSVYDDN